MEKKKAPRVYLGVQTRKKPTHRNRKRLLLDKVFAYLQSDCYMFAPLIIVPPSDFSVPKPIFSSATGLKASEGSKERDNGFAKRVGDYMISDSYMYASMVAPQPPSPSPLVSGQFQSIERVSIEVSTTLVNQGDEPTFQSPNISVKDQPSKHNPSGAGISDQRTLGKKERLQHMFYENCRTSVSGKGMLDSKLSKLVD